MSLTSDLLETKRSAQDSDVWARSQALDPTRSFIVQAPAGSGKTGLLTQRYLRLLSGVSAPEEILALTFTKKAAGEMRDRILEALHSARTKPRPDGEHQALGWDLAQAVLARDAAFGWQVEENPQRLQVVTIDSLCARLGHALPILSQFGASPQPVDDARPLYQEAARRTLAHLDDPESPCRHAIAHLLLHLDNDVRKVAEQIATMLEHRDRWMRPLLELHGPDGFQDLDRQLRRRLEQALEQVVYTELCELKDAFPNEALYQACELLAELAERFDPEPGHALTPWLGYQGGLPGAEPDQLPLWQSLREFLLTRDGRWRKVVNKNHGFLPESETKERPEKERRKACKARMKSLINGLCDQEGVRLKLCDVTSLPPLCYSDAQWETLKALLEISLVAAAELLLVFKSWGKADFVEIAQRAERALGSDEEPTEVTMALDAKLQHILVDEFQDTSLGQLRLLERLIGEWSEHEQRTLFLVGDPMQSIYRFRDAEVGLFLRIRQSGLPNLHLEGLRLRSNFRSQSRLVEWFNEVFTKVFPTLESVTTGAVPYSPADAARPESDQEAVCLHPVLVDNLGEPMGKQKEADRVVEILREIRKDDPQRRVAILTRSRSHLETILPTLRREGFRYQGVDLEPLQSRPVVRDLLALTRALVHPADRVAWLSVLRAPWCGLTSDDLHTVGDDDGEETIFERLVQTDELQPLSDGGRLRLGQMRRVFEQAMGQRRRLPLRRWVESVWLELGGPATLESRSDLEDAQAYLDLLDRLGEEHSRPDLHLLEQKIAKLYAQPDVYADGTLQVMTIHKSKGLQFDTVILPGISQPPRNRVEGLLSWLERPTEDGGSDLLLAPITPSQEEAKDPVYRYVCSLEQKKETNELARLLYVAATRAEQQLHLVARVTEDKKKDFGQLKTPTTGSFLHMLWPAIAEEFEELAASELHACRKDGEASPFSWVLNSEPPEPPPEPEPDVAPPIELRRLSDDWAPPPTPPGVDMPALLPVIDLDLDEQPSFEWAGENAKRVGSVVHRVLQQVGREGLARWPQQRRESLPLYLENALHAAGVPEGDLQSCVTRAQTAITSALQSERGHWIFDHQGPDSRSEYAITGRLRGRVVRAVVDRSFVDEHGVRWAVDYKTGVHQGGDTEAFLDAEMERYRPQLERYAALLRHLDDRPIKMGLYFPLLDGWREWG